MSVLQQFASYNQPPVPPPPPAPAATPAATSSRQQLIEQVRTSPHAPLLWHSQWRVFPEHVFTQSALRGSEESQVIYLYKTRWAPSVAESIWPILGGAKPREQVTELRCTLWGVSFQERLADSTLRILEQAYVFEDRSVIPVFIQRNRLLELLLEARGPLNDAFGEAAVKRLSLIEDDEGSTTLFCLISASGDMQEARQMLRTFDQAWWVAHCGRAAGKLNFDFDLI